MNYKYAATCLFGLEGLLGAEIDALGFHRTETIDGRVYFEGDETAAAKANIWLRTAERVFLVLGSFSAPTFDALFEGTKALPWEEFMGKDDAFPVKGHSVKSQLTSIPDCQKIVKKAASVRLGNVYRTDWMKETGTKYQIEFFILKDVATLMIDLSGTALHKRGYRPESAAAPLRETLAAALVKISRPREDVLFWDPMCGSGTIPTEAALFMTNTAPGLYRGFAGEMYPFIGSKTWSDAREEARSLIRQTGFEAYASDIDGDCVELAQKTVRNAGMDGVVKVFRRNALEITSEGRRGTIVCNPPYGERLLDIKEAEKLYAAMGRHFKTLEPWQIYIITSNESFERLYGRRADAKRKLYNGMIPCTYYQFFKKGRGQNDLRKNSAACRIRRKAQAYNRSGQNLGDEQTP